MSKKHKGDKNKNWRDSKQRDFDPFESKRRKNKSSPKDKNHEEYERLADEYYSQHGTS